VLLAVQLGGCVISAESRYLCHLRSSVPQSEPRSDAVTLAFGLDDNAAEATAVASAASNATD
jgi:hypothetical protein